MPRRLKPRSSARLGDLAAMDAGREVLDDYVTKTWGPSHAAHLAPRTRQTYASTYDRHISSELGGVPLREIEAERVAVFQGKLVRAGVGPHAIRKTMILLGAILQRAAEGRRIAYNPQRVVRRAPLPMAEEVRPLASITIERMRGAAASEREAAILPVLGDAGLRPGELRILRWAHDRTRTLLVTAEKTRRRRTVRRLEPLADDLRAWRRRYGNLPDHALVFAGECRGIWSANAFEKWRRRRFAVLLNAGGLQSGRPYDLRHSFASLLLHEGRDVIYVARQLGHGADRTGT
jgi:integrase